MVKKAIKMFAGHKPVSVLRTQCDAAGVELDTRQYDKGSDHVVLRSKGPSGERAEVLFNTVNGRFFGTTPNGIRFSSDDPLDGTPWFDALLSFFYIEKASS